MGKILMSYFLAHSVDRVTSYVVVLYSLEAANKVLGDLLCLAGAVLYGVSNVCQEYLVCRFGSLQYLAAIGLFGSIVSGIQL